MAMTAGFVAVVDFDILDFLEKAGILLNLRGRPKIKLICHIQLL